MNGTIIVKKLGKRPAVSAQDHMLNLSKDNIELAAPLPPYSGGSGYNGRMTYDERVAKDLADREKYHIVNVDSIPELPEWMRRSRREERNRHAIWWVLMAAFIIGLAIFFIVLAGGGQAHAEADVPEVAAPVTSTSTQVRAVVTAYTSLPSETDNTPFITASGEHTAIGIAACPKEYAFGTVVVIDGRSLVCEDRMNAMYDGQERFDVWVARYDEAVSFGRQATEVSIIN